MAVYALGDVEPQIAPSAFVHPDATVIGNVTIGAESTIWPQAVLRGDEGAIVVGAQTSIQDGSVIHCTSQLDTVIGSRVVIGHLVHLEGCTVEDRSLVGNGSTRSSGPAVQPTPTSVNDPMSETLVRSWPPRAAKISNFSGTV
jgi:carbonic anhydrase/acetyltransferase-like protein (isoleucine patch superfamily)